jgi:hypothetical protein
MPVQLSVTETPAEGLPGMLYDLGPHDVVTKIAADAIDFGEYVSFNDAEHCELPDSASEVTARQGGIALRDPSHPSGTGYAVGDPVPVLRKGRVWVAVEGAVTAGGSAFVRHTAGGGEQQGAFRVDADGTDASIAPTSVYYLGGSTLAVVEINQP